MESRPKRRGSTKRNSRPLLRVRMAWVCGGTGVSGVETSRRPVMPRWMRNCAGWRRRLRPVLRSMTMVLPTRWTRSMRLPVRASAIWSGGVLKVWGLLLVQTERMVWPWVRSWTPLATVSTSGSSGMAFCSIGLAAARLEDGEQAGVVVGPGVEMRNGVDGSGRRGNIGQGEEAGAGGYQNPGGSVFAARVGGGRVEEPGLHPCRSGELRDFGGEVEVLIGDVEGEDAAGDEMFLVEPEGFGGEQVNGNGVARE